MNIHKIFLQLFKILIIIKEKSAKHVFTETSLIDASSLAATDNVNKYNFEDQNGSVESLSISSTLSNSQAEYMLYNDIIEDSSTEFTVLKNQKTTVLNCPPGTTDYEGACHPIITIEQQCNSSLCDILTRCDEELSECACLKDYIQQIDIQDNCITCVKIKKCSSSYCLQGHICRKLNNCNKIVPNINKSTMELIANIYAFNDWKEVKNDKESAGDRNELFDKADNKREEKNFAFYMIFGGGCIFAAFLFFMLRIYKARKL